MISNWCTFDNEEIIADGNEKPQAWIRKLRVHEF
jgi:hypothetical protein